MNEFVEVEGLTLNQLIKLAKDNNVDFDNEIIAEGQSIFMINFTEKYIAMN